MANTVPPNQGRRDTATGPKLRFILLGGFSILVDEWQIPESAFARRKALSVLKLLALEPGHQLHREQVLEHLWPTLNPDSALAQLHKALHHARQAFARTAQLEEPEALVLLSGSLLRLTAPGGVTTDVEEFEARARHALSAPGSDVLQDAAALYRGDLLPGDLYEAWSLERRTQLREQYVELLTALGIAWLAQGRLAEAADALRQAVMRDPTRETAQRTLMLVYARQGNRSRALRQYRRCVATMERELGVSVTAETTALYEAIVDERVPAVELPSRSAGADLTILPPIAGRRQELGLANSLLNGLASGRGAVLGIEGPAGIGKSRLAQEILRLGWQRRLQTLLGEAHEIEGQPPYSPFVEALRRTLWLDPAGADLIPEELSVAIPELPAAARAVRVPDRVAAQSALFAGVSRFFAARARRAPLVLFIDDLHAVDEGSLKLFHYLALETRNLPLLLIGAWRRGEARRPAALMDLIGSLERRQLMHRVSLAPLPEREHCTVLEQVLDGTVDEQLARAIFHSSEGNALFGRELARQLAAEHRIEHSAGVWRLAMPGAELPASIGAPPSVQALAQQRLELLSAPARQLVQLTAVVGRDVPLAVLERTALAASDVTPPLLDRIEEVLASGLLGEAGLSLRFSHPLVRTALYEHISAARRATLHAEVARALELWHADASDTAPVETIAFHYRQAGNVSRAVTYLMRAGERATAVYDHDGARARYQEGLTLLLPQQPSAGHAQQLATLHERIGDTERAIGDMSGSLAAYQHALATADSAAIPGAASRRSTLHRKIALGAILTANMPIAAEHLAQSRASATSDAVEQARLLIAEALYAWHAFEFERAIEHAHSALALAEQAAARVEISQAYEMLALAHMPLGRWEEALSFELRRYTPDWSPEIVVAVDAHLCLYQYTLQDEQALRHTRRFIQAIAQQATTVGNLRCLAVCHFVLGHLALLQGYPLEAATSMKTSRELHERIGSPSGVAYALACQAELLTAAGAFELAPQMVEQGIVASRRAAIRDHCLTQVYTAGIRNRLEAGDETATARLVESALAHDAGCAPCAICRVDLYETLAAASHEFGEPEAAAEYVERALPLADFAHHHTGRARLMRMRGQIQATTGDAAGARRHFREAASTFEEVGYQYDLARTLQALAQLPGAEDRTRLLAEADTILRPYRSPSIAATLRSSTI